MNLQGKVLVITGTATGIGARALRACDLHAAQLPQKNPKGLAPAAPAYSMRNARRWLSLGAVVSTLAHAGCLAPKIPEDPFDAAPYAPTLTSDAGPLSSPDPEKSLPQLPTGADGGSMPGASVDAGHMAPNACDMTGHWLVTDHRIATGLGAKQMGLYWFYLELGQSGGNLTVTKGLLCGGTVRPIGTVSAAVDYHTSWPKMLSDNPLAGWTGSVTESGSGCNFRMNRYYVIMGATASYYRDPSKPLPTLDQQAMGGKPGWEDWDHDGRPGVSLSVSGLANGTRAEVIRSWGEYNGPIAKGASSFKVPCNWGQDESVLWTSSDILKSTGAVDGDKTLHFVQWAKLSDGQVSGADDAICEQIRTLAPQLTAEANTVPQ